MKTSKAYTLVELLVVIFFLGLLSVFLISSYRSIIGEGKSTSVSTEREREFLALHNYLKKTLGSIGFGISREMLKVAGVNCIDNNLANFKAQNAVIGLAENCSLPNTPLHDRLYFRSLYAPGSLKAGCWWYIDPSGYTSSMGVDKWGKPCEIDQGDPCLFLDINKNLLSTENCNPPPCKNCFAFYYNSTSPQVFRLHLDEIGESDTSQRQRCAPKTGILKLQREYNILSHPLFDCVGGLRFELLYSQNSTLPYAVRVCLLVQTSGKMNSPREIPNSSSCGAFYNTLPDPMWTYYRWSVVEEIIPLKNLQ
ncbi:MAG: hypothetical protein ACK4GE_04010 [Caldimicrobium sp.]